MDSSGGFGEREQERVLACFPEGALAEIERLLRSPSPSVRGDLALWIWSFVEERKERRIPAKKIAAKLERIHRTAVAYRDLLNSLCDGETEWRLVASGFDLDWVDLPAIDLADDLASAAAKALTRKDKGGHPAEVARAVLLNNLGDLYRRSTGKKPRFTSRTKGEYSGSFVRIAELVDQAAAVLAGTRPLPNSTLGEAVRQRKRRP